MNSLKVKPRTTQTTLKRQVSFTGVGLHSGQSVTCTLHPAPANHGVVFLRSDMRQQARIKADISRVVRTDMSTTLGDRNGTVVGTVEHLMAALSGMGVDNILVELSGPELPIMDGSAIEFAHGIKDAGVRYLQESRKVLRLRRTVSVRQGDKWIEASPAKILQISGGIEFDHSVIGEQRFSFADGSDFCGELAAARTFGFLKEVEYLHKKGLALGGSLDNAVVLDETRVLNPEGLRFNDEFVRHKVLDAMGDFALLGIGLQAKIRVHKAGHELHAGFLMKVLDDSANYEIVDLAALAAEATIDPSLDLGFAVPA